MRISGTVDFQAPAQDVWKSLITPEVLGNCTPGLENWSELEPARTFDLQLRWDLNSSRSVQVPVTIVWDTLHPPHAMEILLTAVFGAQRIDGNAAMQLTAVDTQATTLDFTLELDIANKMTTQMLQNLAPRFIDGFFKCLKTRLETPA